MCCAARLRSGTGDRGTVTAPDGQLMASTCDALWWPLVSDAAWGLESEAVETTPVDGRAAVVTHRGCRNFAHALLDGMARVWLVRRSGVEPDVWITPADPPPWLDELLSRAGVTPGKRLPVHSRSRFIADELIVPTPSGFATRTAPWVRGAVQEVLGVTGAPGAEAPQRVWGLAAGTVEAPLAR